MVQGWKFDNSQPIYLQIVDELTRRITAGVYELGDRLPSVRDFAVEAGVNPNTMQRALATLEQRGLITTERASGKYVTTDRSVLMELKKDLIGEHIAQCIRSLEQMGLTRDEILAAIHSYLERRA